MDCHDLFDNLYQYQTRYSKQRPWPNFRNILSLALFKFYYLGIIFYDYSVILISCSKLASIKPDNLSEHFLIKLVS